MIKEDTIRDVVGYEGLYTVDIFGNVYNAKGEEKAQRKDINGYMDISLYKDNKEKRWKVHRLVALAFIPNPQDKPHINHIDGDKTHNCVWNLEWVTPKENTHHAIATKLRNDELRDLIGQKFGRLTVIEYVGKRRDKKEHVRNLWKCKCDCGKEHIVTDNNLITGAVKSCGCQKGHKKCVE